ncbi:MAG: PAS domain-containing protein, partial [Candidatus Electrothrix sp. AUS4]|nr:PAS domain-containing protein [Candidatus Electrothrix sp. AUS4]
MTSQQNIKKTEQQNREIGNDSPPALLPASQKIRTKNSVMPERQCLPDDQNVRTLQNYIADLEAELQLTKENLQTTVEELQATNEELYAANAEFERKNNELEALNREHQNLLDNLLSGVVVHDRDGGILFSNPEARRILGLPETETEAGDTDWHFTNAEGEILPETVCPVARIVGRHETIPNELLGIKRPNDHQITWVYLHGMPVPGSNGQVDKVIINFVEVTDLQRAKYELQEKTALLSMSQHIGQLGSWVLDAPADRLEWSDETYRIFGLQPQEFQASYEAFLELVHPEDRDIVDQAYSKSIEQGTNSYETEHRIIRPEDKEIRFV